MVISISTDTSDSDNGSSSISVFDQHIYIVGAKCFSYIYI